MAADPLLMLGIDLFDTLVGLERAHGVHERARIRDSDEPRAKISGPPQFGEKTTVKVGRGKTKFTARFTLKTGLRWVLRLVNKHAGQSPSDSGLKTVNVK